jgi:hypothetical protein
MILLTGKGLVSKPNRKLEITNCDLKLQGEEPILPILRSQIVTSSLRAPLASQTSKVTNCDLREYGFHTENAQLPFDEHLFPAGKWPILRGNFIVLAGKNSLRAGNDSLPVDEASLSVGKGALRSAKR